MHVFICSMGDRLMSYIREVWKNMNNKFNIVELHTKVYLTKDIPNKSTAYEISRLCDKSLLHDKTYSVFHRENRYKNYCFNSFYPLEDNKIYKKGKIYTIIIRNVDKNLADHFKKYLINEYTESIKVLDIEAKTIPRRHIENIYSITPIIIKSENGYWKGNLSLNDYETRIRVNLIKKYNEFHGVKLDENFELFTFTKFLNQKPVGLSYKDIELLGDKLSLTVAENETAQDLAYFSLGTGIGEMGARGFGFMNFKWL